MESNTKKIVIILFVGKRFWSYFKLLWKRSNGNWNFFFVCVRWSKKIEKRAYEIIIFFSKREFFLTLPLAGPFLYIVQITFIWSNMYQKSWNIILGSLLDLSDTNTRPLRHQNYFLMTSHTTTARKTMVFSSIHVIHKEHAYQRLQNTQKRTFFT